MVRNPENRPVSRRRALGLAAAGLVWLAPAAVLATSTGSGGRSADRLSATRYYTFDPFTIPILTDQEIREQFVLVIAVELKEDGQRDEIGRFVPKVRDAMYTELYRMVTFRRAGTGIPPIDLFKDRLYAIARRIVGDEIVAALIVQQAYKRRAR